MKRTIYFLLTIGVVIGLLATGCAKTAPTPVPAPKPSQTPALAPTPTPAPAPAPSLTPSPAKVRPKQIRWLSPSVGTSNFATDAYLADIFVKELKIPSGAFPGAAGPNLTLLNDGEGELASGPDEALIVAAYKGQEPYTRTLTNLRYMYNRGGFGTVCAVRADSNIKTLKDLIGKKIGVGGKGEVAHKNSVAMLEGAGITVKDIEAAGGVLAFMSYAAMGEALLGRTLDATWFNSPRAAVHPSHKMVEERAGLRLIPVPDEALTNAIKKNPLLSKMKIKGGTYKGSPDDHYFIGGAVAITVRTDLPDDLVYELTKLIYRPDVAKWVATNQELFNLMGDTEDGLIASEYIPMHPGAAKFWSVDRNVDLKSKGITVK